jgi:hypothetical protein
MAAQPGKARRPAQEVLTPMHHAGYRCPPMTRQHFCFIASIVATLDGEREHVAEAFAAMLAETNPRFNRARFIAACEVQS